MASATGTVKFANQGAADFAKMHAIAALVEANIDDTRVAKPRPHDRHTINKPYRIYLAQLNKRQVSTDNANLAYALDLTRYEEGKPIPADRFLTWYLPWNPNGGQTDMMLTRDPLRDDHGNDVNPGVFFTTQLTGCSVFIRGRPDKPQVFHSGIGTNPTWQGSSSAHWRALFQAAHPKTFTRGEFAEVNANQYIGAKFLGQKTYAPHIQSYLDSLKQIENISHRTFNVIDCMGIGCVFGTRDTAGNWTFYLQENIRVAYTRDGSTNFKWGNRPVRLSEIFPNRQVLHTNMIAKVFP